MKKTKFKLNGTGRVKTVVNDEVVIIKPDETIEVKSEDNNYAYFVNNKRWTTLTEEDYKATSKEDKIDKRIKDITEDLKDDGKRNYSNDPNKESPGRKKKEDD